MSREDNWSDTRSLACRTCRFFVKKARHAGDGGEQAVEEAPGRCRRRAPIVELGWPVVFPTDWCGEHKLGDNPRR